MSLIWGSFVHPLIIMADLSQGQALKAGHSRSTMSSLAKHRKTQVLTVQSSKGDTGHDNISDTQKTWGWCLVFGYKATFMTNYPLFSMSRNTLSGSNYIQYISKQYKTN